MSELQDILPGFDRERARITAQHANTSVGPSACNVIVDAVIAYFEPLVRQVAESKAKAYSTIRLRLEEERKLGAAERAARQAAEQDLAPWHGRAMVAEAALRRAVEALKPEQERLTNDAAHLSQRGVERLATVRAAVAAPSAARAQAEHDVLRCAIEYVGDNYVDGSEKLDAAVDRLRAVEAAEKGAEQP